MNKENEKLKSCPFCGGEAEVVQVTKNVYVRCRKCGALAGDVSFKEKVAIAAWNRRNYPEKQDSLKELMDFVKFCRNASTGCIVYINNRARDLIAKHKECCKYAECKDGREINFPTIPKLTYANVEKMVKPLEWKYAEKRESLDVYKDWKSNLFFLFYQFDIRLSSDNFKALYLYDGHGHTIPLDAGREDVEYYKHSARKFLVDLVADALGISGGQDER